MREKGWIIFVSKMIDRLMELEEKGRELASARDERVLPGDWHWLDDVRSEMDKLEPFVIDEVNFVKSLMDTCYEFEEPVDKCLIRQKRSECMVLLDPPSSGGKVSSKRITMLAWINGLSEELFGKKCTWLFGEIPHSKYSESALLNDLSSCVHQLADHLRKKYGDLHIEGKCAWEV
jgi:hypothetical protein